MKALVVEDAKTVQMIFRTWFEKAGFTVLTAASKVEAEIILAEDPPPEVITVDINLMDIQGEETFDWIQKLRMEHPDALLLVISGVLKETDGPRLAKLGADGAFEKMDITIERSWWQKILDAISGVSKQDQLVRNLRVLEGITNAVKSVYNAAGSSLRLTPPAELEPTAEIATQKKAE